MIAYFLEVASLHMVFYVLYLVFLTLLESFFLFVMNIYISSYPIAKMR